MPAMVSDCDLDDCGVGPCASTDSAGSTGRSGAASKKLSLQKLLQKVDSRDAEMDAQWAHDPDQVEMAKRIKKCLALKETLKSVLGTVQLTQDTETCALKKMRKLRNELKVSELLLLLSCANRSQLMCSAESDPSLSREDHQNFCLLHEQRLRENCQSSNGSASNSVVGNSSHPSLHGLGYQSDQGSDDSVTHLAGSHDARESRTMSTSPNSGLHSSQTVGSTSIARRRSISPPHLHVPSANIPIIPPVHRMTPSQSAAVAVSGVAAFSFMTTATTGSDQGDEVAGGAAEERLSIGSNSSFGHDQDFQDLAAVCVDGLKVGRPPSPGCSVYLTCPSFSYFCCCSRSSSRRTRRARSSRSWRRSSTTPTASTSRCANKLLVLA